MSTRLRTPAPRRGSPRTPTRTPAPSCERCSTRPGPSDADATAALTDAFGPASSSAPPDCAARSGPGPNRMNRVVVIRAAAGLAAYLRDLGRHAAAVVIGYDARHKSDVFARDTAEVVHGCRHAGVRAPASAAHPRAGVRDPAPRRGRRRHGHRDPQPAAGQRLQGLPRRRLADRAARRPRDRRADRRRRRPRRACRAASGWDDPRRGRARRLPRPRRVTARCPADRATSSSSTRRCTGSVVRSCARRCTGPASPSRTSSRSRRWPDPDFPTVSFPNPEEPGAMDLALALAEDVDADLVIANDPDADRCAVAVAGRDGVCRMLRGDEVGALLATHLIARGLPAGHDVLACSIVSSSLLSRIAAAHGLPYAETLTGFKWIGRVPHLALRLRGGARLLRRLGGRQRQGRHHRGAARRRARRVAEGRGPRPDRPARRHRHRARPARDRPALRPGRRPDADRRRDGASPRRHRRPRSVDVASRSSRTCRSGPVGCRRPTACAIDWPSHGRVVVRPSGTEPKLKCYLEVVIPVVDGDVDAAHRRASGDLAAIRDDLSAALDL